MKSTSFAALTLMSILSFSTLEARPAGRVSLDPFEVTHLQIPSAKGTIELDVPAGVTALHQSLELGYVVLTWTSEKESQGQLTLPSGSWNLDLAVGKAAVVISPEGKLSRLGAVEAYSSFVCGPQGARCPVAAPEWKNPSTYPCGPQGAVCSAEGPTVDLSEETQLAGPNR